MNICNRNGSGNLFLGDFLLNLLRGVEFLFTMIGCHGFLMLDSGFFFKKICKNFCNFFPPKIEKLVDFTQEK